MERYFSKYRDEIIGGDLFIKTPYHSGVRMIYADWTASGRMYYPIEQRLLKKFLPLVANTHTDTNHTGSAMTYAYHEAQHIIKEHVGANGNDILINSGSGMTGVINKLQRILGLKIHERFQDHIQIAPEDRPVVFTTHMEHHSNQTSWLETIAEVVVVEPDEDCLVSVENFKATIDRYKDRKVKIAAITACSNVTGIMTPYYEIAQVIHQAGGVCFVDFACSAPYVDIDMHLNDRSGKYLDAIYFSPHKFLGGPGSTGILVFNKKLYTNSVPDHPGGGTVNWTNPWGERSYVSDIEAREDGGTPAFLQTIRAALCMQLKKEMSVEKIRRREEEIIDLIWDELSAIPNIHILAKNQKKRLGIVSFYIDDLHYNIGVKLLNDRFGIQTRGGCSCAGTYGHHLLNVSKTVSKGICDMIDTGDLSTKPGWIRLSIHPTHTDHEVRYMVNAIKQLALHFREWEKDYDINYKDSVIKHKDRSSVEELEMNVQYWFEKQFA
ncbi:aminotransferase class V-fold PLP-dependent enzyme [Telluribacter sp. SYSU D00476]|uniref:aminotransferase class V-fold PLP-dependent enzyme n=1 Tax=Telluribacter sp. SYSU D00476 TaxID=2811430 RepID=UPI001FF4A9A7|nr:aminotransferase class V-fold PLP-dependent enzyme [Telluribacter sp. SYSU D00476]